MDAGLADAAFLPRVVLMDDEYQRAMCAAELAWIDGVVADLRSGSWNWTYEEFAELAGHLQPDGETLGPPSTSPRRLESARRALAPGFAGPAPVFVASAPVSVTWRLGYRQVPVLVGHEAALVDVAEQDLVQHLRAGERRLTVYIRVQHVQRLQPEHQRVDIAHDVLHVVLTERQQPQAARPDCLSVSGGLPAGCPSAARMQAMFRSPTCWVTK